MHANLGAVDGERAWRQGPLTVLPQLAALPAAENAAVRAAFRRRCASAGLISDRGEFTHRYRLLDLYRRREQHHAPPSPSHAANAEQLRQQATPQHSSRQREQRLQEQRSEQRRQRERAHRRTGTLRLHPRHEHRRQQLSESLEQRRQQRPPTATR